MKKEQTGEGEAKKEKNDPEHSEEKNETQKKPRGTRMEMGKRRGEKRGCEPPPKLCAGGKKPGEGGGGGQ